MFKVSGYAYVEFKFFDRLFLADFYFVFNNSQAFRVDYRL